MRAAVTAWMVVAATSAASSAAAAEPPTLSVARSEPAADCPGADDLAAAVNARSGRHAVDATTSGGDVEVTFTRDAEVVRATIRASGARAGERLVEDRATSCSAVAKAVELAIVLLLDEVAAGTPARAPAEAPTKPTTPSLRIDASAGGGVGFGLVDGFSPLVVADVGFAPGGRWSARLGGVWVPPSSTSLPPGTVDTSLGAGYVDLCFGIPRDGPVKLCASPHGGVIHGSGHGFTTDGSVTRPWFAAGLAASFDGRLVGILGWRARVEALWSLTRERLAIAGVGVAYEPSPAAIVLAVGPTLSFP